MIEGVPIRGIVIGRQGVDTALVQIASESEVAALANTRATVAVTPVMLGLPTPDAPLIDAILGGSVYALMPDGSFVPIGQVRDVSVRAERIDVTSWGDSSQRFVAGPRRLVFSGEGPVR